MQACAFLFLAQMIAFAATAGYAAAEHASRGAMNVGVLLALVNLLGFVMAMHAWLRPRES